MITFWIDGLPAAQGSKKHVGRGIMVEANKNLPAWRKAIETTVAELHKGEPDCPRDADWRACPGCASVVNGYARTIASHAQKEENND